MDAMNVMAARAGRRASSKHGRLAAIAGIPGVFAGAFAALTATPVVLYAQAAQGGSDIFGKAQTFLQNAETVIGVLMIVAGLVLLIMGAFAFREGRGGLGSMVAAAILILVGFNVANLQTFFGF
jgi:hypothetical protein